MFAVSMRGDAMGTWGTGQGAADHLGVRTASLQHREEPPTLVSGPGQRPGQQSRWEMLSGPP